MSTVPEHQWNPIEPLAENWEAFARPDLQALVEVWREQTDELREKVGRILAAIEKTCREVIC